MQKRRLALQLDLELYAADLKKIRILFFFSFFFSFAKPYNILFSLPPKNKEIMAGKARNLETAATDVMTPMLRTLRVKTTPPSAEVLDAQARMSRSRFAVAQCTSMVGALIFLLGIGLYCLTRIEGLSDVLLDKCDNPTSRSSLCRLVQSLAKATATTLSDRAETSTAALNDEDDTDDETTTTTSSMTYIPEYAT